MLHLAWIALLFAVFFTILFFPMVHALQHSGGPDSAGAGIGILLLSILRVGAMIAGLVFAAGAGRMSDIGSSRAGQIALLILTAIVAEVVSCGLHFFSIDFRGGDGLRMAGAVFATLLPGLLLASAFAGLLGTGKGSAILCFTSLAGSIIIGIAAVSVSESHDRKRREERAKQQEIDEQVEARAEEQRLSRTKMEISEMRESAGIEVPLAFVGKDNAQEVRDLAIEKIRSWKNHNGLLTAALTGKHRFEALALLASVAQDLTPGEREKCWQTVGLIAEDFAKRLPNHENTLPVNDLFGPTADLMKVPGEPTREQEKYVLAVQEVVRLADRNFMVFRVSPMIRDYKQQPFE